ncbi:MAG: GntR family transcriptional regulator [Armatimonadota bacterium]|nr:GntR family transcriptional regulator [Armatimonadota bacterium]
MQIISEQVTDILRQRLVEQVYRPGERVMIDRLARELGVSHTPIREALGRLQGEGLVVYRRNQGYYVTPLTDREILEMLDCRLMLETFAVQQITPITDDLVERLEAIHGRFCRATALRQRYETNVADREFHEAIVAATGNALLLRLFCSMNSHMRTMRLFHSSEDMPPRNLAEHERIMAAFRRRSNAEAAEAIAEHLQSVKRRVQTLARQRAISAPSTQVAATHRDPGDGEEP